MTLLTPLKRSKPVHLSFVLSRTAFLFFPNLFTRLKKPPNIYYGKTGQHSSELHKQQTKTTELRAAVNEMTRSLCAHP